MENSSAIVTLTHENFEQEVLNSDRPVLVDFWAPWCGPCRLITPLIEALATEFVGRAKVAKLNVDQYERLATRYQIGAIPTLLFFKQGQVVDEVVGVLPKKELVAKLALLISEGTIATAA